MTHWTVREISFYSASAQRTHSKTSMAGFCHKIDSKEVFIHPVVIHLPVDTLGLVMAAGKGCAEWLISSQVNQLSI